MKLTALIALVLVAGSANALETALTQSNGASTITIDPALGTISLYTIQDGKLNKKPTYANFLTDLRLFLKQPQVHGDWTRNALQVGSGNNKPSYDEMLALIATADSAKRPANVLPYGERAKNAEIEFWDKVTAKDNPYDGVISAALGQRYLVIAVPSVRSFIMYEIQAEQIVTPPRAFHNWGPELYVPQVWQSTPTAEQMIRDLPTKEMQDEQRKALHDEADAAATSTQKSLPTQNSDIWIAAGAQDRVVLVDFPNKHLMSYQFDGKLLNVVSVRDMRVDLSYPVSFNTLPNPRQMFDEFKNDKTRREFLLQLGITDLDVADIKSVVASNQKTSSKISPIQAIATASTTFDVVIDFTQQQRILTYRVVGAGNQLECSGMRDYSVDSALAQLDNMRQERLYADQLFAQARQLVTSHHDELGWLSMKTALNLNPNLHASLEKAHEMVKTFSAMKDWEKTINEATQAAEREQKRIEDRIAKAKELREKPKAKDDKKK